jgi:hypothetical protein
VRVDELATPLNDAELYDLDVEALLLRPYMTGDVFTDVEVGDEAPSMVMIIGHPCVIRGSRGKLSRRVPCCVMKQMESELPYGEWPERRFDRFPVSSALGLGERQAAALLEWRSVRSAGLSREQRRATMTDRGVYILQQRFTHAITRCAVPLADFEASSRNVMREAELEYEWVGDLTADPKDEGEVSAHIKDFHTFLDEGDHRKLLTQEGGHSPLRAIVRAELKGRRGS